MCESSYRSLAHEHMQGRRRRRRRTRRRRRRRRAFHILDASPHAHDTWPFPNRHRMILAHDPFHLSVLLISMQDGDAYKTGKYEMARHSNFVRSMYGRYGRRSEAVLSCTHNESVCGALLEKGTDSAWSTCCWGKMCKDLKEDPYHCGECGRACGYGLSCCNGDCVDLNMDSQNCGACGNVCAYQEECSFGMCDYAGATFISPPPPLHGPKHR